MSAAILSGASLAAVQRSFLAALPSMTNVIRFQLRNWPTRHRAEAIADARAAAWHAWVGLARRGKDPRAIGPTGIAANAARYLKNGRRLGCGTVGRGAMDIYHPRAQHRLGIRLISLDRHAGPGARDGWREWLAQDRRFGPADEACIRIDFAAWLAGLPQRKQQVAELLAQGQETGVVARMLNVTPSAVCQLRTRLEASWYAYQGEAVVGSAAPVRKPRGRPAGSRRGARR